MSKSKKAHNGAASRRRGKAFENKVAKILNGHIHTGIDGDVLAYDRQGRMYRFECKSRQGLKFNQNDELWHFLDQVKRYVTEHWDAGQPWALALYGGRGAMFKELTDNGVFFLVSDREYKRLTGLGGSDGSTDTASPES